jgi:hypothetical protein
MSENTPFEPQPGQGEQPGTWDRREERRQQRELRHEERSGRSGDRGGWIVGAVLILIGIVLFMQNAGLSIISNWWALFILIPAVGCFTSAWNNYKAAGDRLTSAVRGPLLCGFVLTMVTLIFLLNLNWGLLWPVLLVMAGIGMLVNGLLPE